MPKTQTGNIQLLKMIKRFPELYNLQHDLANDKAHSMVVWDTISDELETPVDVLKKKWQKLSSLHKKRCRSLKAFSKSGASTTSLPQDDVFLLMETMLETNAAGVDSPGETDDSSLCSVPTLSIISEEGRSTRSSSSASTQLVSEHRERSPCSSGKILPEFASSSSSSSFPSASSSGGKIAPSSTRVLRSHNNNLRLRRATRSGPPEIARNRQKDASTIFSGGDSAISTSGKTRSSVSENREKKNARLSNRSDNETAKAFFQNMALTVAKFPPHIQTATKTKIFNIVSEAEAELSSVVTMR